MPGRGMQGTRSVDGEPHPPQDRLAGAAVLKRDHVADLVANVDIHFVRHAQGELDSGLLVRLRAHHAPVLVADGEAVLGTPLRHLRARGDVSAARKPTGARGVSGVTVSCVYPQLPLATKERQRNRKALAGLLTFDSHMFFKKGQVKIKGKILCIFNLSYISENKRKQNTHKTKN